MEVSDRLLRFVQSFEGFSPRWYDDGLGYDTIGWGFLRSEWSKSTITRGEADALLRRLLSTRYADPVLRAEKQVGWELPPGARDALISFTYNLGGGWVGGGGGNFASIWTAFRAKSIQGVADSFIKYRNPGTAVEAGLRRRRLAERDMWLDGWKNQKPDPLALLTEGERKDVKRLQQYRANAKKRGEWIDSERKTATSIKDRLKDRIANLKDFSDKELKKENRRERLAILRDAVANRKLEV